MSHQTTIPYYSEADLAALDISTQEVIDSIESLITGTDKGTVWSAPKAVILPPDGRYMMAAMAAADEPALLAVKTVVLNARNYDRGLPQINGLVTMLDSETGLPVAIMDGNWITAVRTAGLSAVAAKYMARPDAATIAFVGCGVQAHSHLKAFTDMFPLTRAKVLGRGRPNIEALCRTAEELGLATTVCSSGEDAMAEADLVVTSVSRSPGLEPFLDPDWLAPGAFAAITDLADPWHKERFMALDRIVIDDLEQEAASAVKLVPPDVVTGDLSGLVLGAIQGRDSADERNAFIFRGHGLGDLALAALAYRKAHERADA